MTTKEERFLKGKITSKNQSRSYVFYEKKSENEYPPSEDDAKFRRRFCQVKDMYDLDEVDLQQLLGMIPTIEMKDDTEPIPKRVMTAIQNYVKATHSNFGLAYR